MTASSKIDNQVVAFAITSPKANHATISECIVDDGRVLVGGAESDMIKSLATASDLSRTTTHDGALCINRVFLLPREEALSTFLRGSYPFQWDVYNQQKWLWFHQKSVQSCNQGQQNRFIRLFFVCDAKEGQVQVYVNLSKTFIAGIPGASGKWPHRSSLGSTMQLRDRIEGMKFVSTNLIRHYHLITHIDHIFSQSTHFKRHFGIPNSFFEFDPSTLITPRNADLALQVSNIQQTRFQLDRKGLLLLASNSALNLHFFMALPGHVIPIMTHEPEGVSLRKH